MAILDKIKSFRALQARHSVTPDSLGELLEQMYSELEGGEGSSSPGLDSILEEFESVKGSVSSIKDLLPAVVYFSGFVNGVSLEAQSATSARGTVVYDTDRKTFLYQVHAEGELGTASSTKYYSNWGEGADNYGSPSGNGRVPRGGRIYYDSSRYTIYLLYGSELVAVDGSYNWYKELEQEIQNRQTEDAATRQMINVLNDSRVTPMGDQVTKLQKGVAEVGLVNMNAAAGVKESLESFTPGLLKVQDYSVPGLAVTALVGARWRMWRWNVTDSELQETVKRGIEENGDSDPWIYAQELFEDLEKWEEQTAPEGAVAIYGREVGIDGEAGTVQLLTAEAKAVYPVTKAGGGAESGSAAGKQLFIDLWKEACYEHGGYDQEKDRFILYGDEYTFEQAVKIYNARPTGFIGRGTNDNGNAIKLGSVPGSYLPLMPIKLSGRNEDIDLYGFMANFGTSAIKKIGFVGTVRVARLSNFLYNTRYVEYIYGVLDVSKCTEFKDAFSYEALRQVYFKNLKVSISTLGNRKNLNYESLKYLVDNAANTEEITVTVHADVFARLTGDGDYSSSDGSLEEWTALNELAISKNITFATA